MAKSKSPKSTVLDTVEGPIELLLDPGVKINDIDGSHYFDKTPRKLMVAASEGWVFVGQCTFEEDGGILIEDAYNIRRWGTEHGLGQLRDGPLSETEADPYGTVKIFNPILIMEVNQKANWAKKGKK